MSQRALGEFEQLVLLAIVHVEGETYGVPIMEAIEERSGRRVDRTAVYVTLRRLESRGLVRSWMSDPRPERGGKARRCVAVTDLGLRALLDSRRVIEQMWGGLTPDFSTLKRAQGSG